MKSFLPKYFGGAGMYGFRNYRLLFSILAFTTLVGIGFKPRPTMLAVPASGPDFQKNENDLSHPIRIIS